MTRVALFRGVVAGSLSALLLLGGRGPAVARDERGRSGAGHGALPEGEGAAVGGAGRAGLSGLRGEPAPRPERRDHPESGAALHELEGAWRTPGASSTRRSCSRGRTRPARSTRRPPASGRGRLERRACRGSPWVVPAGVQVEGLQASSA